MTASGPTLFAAIGTPLAPADTLDANGLERHLDAQWQAGLHGVLVGGSMGAMQLLTDRAYGQLVERSATLCTGRGELLVGVGDTSFARTVQRIELLNGHRVDGAVVLTPFLFKFQQSELVDYFTRLAFLPRHPLYLYNLPGLVGVDLEPATIEQIAEHPNVRGIKMSNEIGATRRLIERLGDRLRIFVVQPTRVIELLREGLMEHLDGMFAAAPDWAVAMARCAAEGDWASAFEHQERITRLSSSSSDSWYCRPSASCSTRVASRATSHRPRFVSWLQTSSASCSTTRSSAGCWRSAEHDGPS